MTIMSYSLYFNILDIIIVKVEKIELNIGVYNSKSLIQMIMIAYLHSKRCIKYKI